jgi:hypothetical protein
VGRNAKAGAFLVGLLRPWPAATVRRPLPTGVVVAMEKDGAASFFRLVSPGHPYPRRKRALRARLPTTTVDGCVLSSCLCFIYPLHIDASGLLSLYTSQRLSLTRVQYCIVYEFC